jgi:hypothetical protein
MPRGRPTNAIMTEDHRPKDASASSSSEVCNGRDQDSQDQQQGHQEQEQFNDTSREWHDGGKGARQSLSATAPEHQGRRFADTEDYHDEEEDILMSPKEVRELQKITRTIGFLAVGDQSLTPKPFGEPANCGDKAEKWLEQFNLYTTFRKINDDEKLQLFKMLLVDHAGDWLRSLEPQKVDSIKALTAEFKKRHELTTVDKWKQTMDLWSRKQMPTETVLDYITSMKSAAKRVDMSLDNLANAIIQGLKPEIKFIVLQNNCRTIDQISDTARVAEVAHSATTSSADQQAKLESKVDVLLETVAKLAANQSSSEKRVSFVQAPVDHAEQRRGDDDYYPRRRRQYSVSPVDTARDRRTTAQSSTSPGRYRRVDQSRSATPEADYRTPPPQRQYRDDRRTQPQRREWHLQPQNTTTPTAPTGPQTHYATSYNSWQGNCRFCGRKHQFGRQFCPAANLRCHQCSKIGHMARMCRSAMYTQNMMYNSQH